MRFVDTNVLLHQPVAKVTRAALRAQGPMA